MQNYTVNGRELVTLDAAVSTIYVDSGSIAAFNPTADLPELAAAGGETPALEYRPGQPALDIYSPRGATLRVLFSNEAEAAENASQEVSEVSGGSLADKSLEELRDIATERDIPGRGGLNKADLLALIEEDEANA